jgi:exodeoxyribonuclease V gamma subunit
MSLTIHTGNKMEMLLSCLGDVLEEPVGSPLTPETIVVQSRGMQRWLSMQLAQRFGVWANCRYPFPNKFVWDLFVATMPEVSKTDHYEPGILLWRIMGLLDGLLDRPEFAELKGYLEGKNRGLKLYQLSGKIADTFDQYTLYRGSMLEAWEAGKENNWQAVLWRALLKEGKGQHRYHVRSEFLRRLDTTEISRSIFPHRISVFGISYLPPFHMDVFARLSEYSDLHMFIMSPCREYWGDLLSPRTISRLPEDARSMVDEGNALLSSLGRLGRDFSNLILEYGATCAIEREQYSDFAGDSLLASLQNGILALRKADPDNRITIAATDGSIAVHACHSPMREVEVLHDQLLELFSTMAGLNPRDIIVMTPDVETYAPYITAVFDGVTDHARRIPFTIVDRSLRGEGRIGETVMAILALPGSRFTAPGVMDILACGPVRRSIGLSASDLDLVRGWLEETNIRWGFDEKDRSRQGVPAYRDNSWVAGLERLVAGYALSNEENLLFDDLLPFDNMEGAAAEVLGKLVSFVNSLHAFIECLTIPRSLDSWKSVLMGMLERFFEPGNDDLYEFNSIAGIVDTLGEISEHSGFGGEIGLDVITLLLQGRLNNEGSGFGFLTGKVTFCAMLPMRSIPSRVVVLLGMNDGAFPRQNRAPGFDLISSSPPQPGDRSLRDEDRYLFLEALLSARERLYLSYTGLSIRDNSVIPPSVLVSELLDFLDQCYQRGGEALSRSLVTMHRLQPFNAGYFKNSSELFSYSKENCDAVSRQFQRCALNSHFFRKPLPAPPDEFRTVSLADLLWFYGNPSAYLLKKRLGIRLENQAPPLSEREPFDVDSLARYSIKQEMLSYAIDGRNPEELRPVIRARGVLPPALQGDMLFSQLVVEAVEMADRVRTISGGFTALPPLDPELKIGEFTLSGRLDGLLSGGLLRYRCAKLGCKDQIKLWIEHLVLNAAAQEGYPLTSTLVMQDKTIRLPMVTDSIACLENLLKHYGEGQLLPLKFFPRSSHAFARSGKRSDAEKKWDDQRYPEKNDPSYMLCFGDENPFDSQFETIAGDVFKPYLECAGGGK